MSAPLTDLSLLRRLQQPDDSQAWSRFVEIYSPVIRTTALRCGLQPADADEVSQEVLIKVSKQLHRFDPKGQAKFASWLQTVARNATIDYLRARRWRGTGRTSVSRALQNQPTQSISEPSPSTAEIFENQSRSQWFHWAAKQVKEQVAAQMWNCFWRTAVQDESPQVVAREYGLTVGAVYLAKSRVLAKIRRTIEREREAGNGMP